MGEQVNIYSLAERMIRLCGLHPHPDIEILVTGLRPGERLDEAVVGPAETSAPAGDGAPVLVISPVHLDHDALVDGPRHPRAPGRRPATTTAPRPRCSASPCPPLGVPAEPFAGTVPDTRRSERVGRAVGRTPDVTT